LSEREEALVSIRRDAWLGVLLLAVTLVLGYSHLTAGRRLHRDYWPDPGPALLPELLLLVLLLGGAALLIGAGLRAARLRAVPGFRPDGTFLAAIAYPILLMATLTLYVVVLRAAGFPAATLAFAALWCVVLAVREGGRPRPLRVALWLGQAAAITLAIYYVFRVMLGVPLP
jgi:hypothetical protein